MEISVVVISDEIEACGRGTDSDAWVGEACRKDH